MDLELVKLFFPQGIFEYFDIVKYSEISEKIHFYLEEKNILPNQYKSEPAQSKGFLDEIII